MARPLSLEDGYYFATKKNNKISYLIAVKDGVSRECVGSVGSLMVYSSHSGFYNQWGIYTKASPEQEKYLKKCIRRGGIVKSPPPIETTWVKDFLHFMDESKWFIDAQTKQRLCHGMPVMWEEKFIGLLDVEQLVPYNNKRFLSTIHLIGQPGADSSPLMRTAKLKQVASGSWIVHGCLNEENELYTGKSIKPLILPVVNHIKIIESYELF